MSPLFPLHQMLGLLAVAATIIFLICRTEKSPATKLLQVAAVFIVPAALYIYAAHNDRCARGDRLPFHLVNKLFYALSDETIPDAQIVDAFVDDDAWQTANRLEELRKLPYAEQSNENIAWEPPEREPEPILWHTLPESGESAELSDSPDLTALLKYQEYMVRVWDGKGVIVTGKLRVEGAADHRSVASRSFILPDGTFAHVLHPGKDCELQFFKSGYEAAAIWLDPNKNYPPRLDLGIVTLRKAIKTGSVEFRLQLPSKTAAATVKLETGVPAATGKLPTPEWAKRKKFAPSLHRTVTERHAVNGETLRIDGLSKLPYMLTVSAAGCVRRIIYFTGGKNVNLGEITLSEARRQTFRTRDFIGGKMETVTLELNGETSLVVTEHDGYGKPAAIRLTPDRNSMRILADFVWRPVYYYDYGITPLPETSPLPNQRPILGGRIFMEPGHLYRMLSNDIHHIDKFIYLDPVEGPTPR